MPPHLFRERARPICGKLIWYKIGQDSGAGAGSPGFLARFKHHHGLGKAKDMPGRKWSQEVTEHSDALDLEKDLFTKDDPKEIARSLKRSAEHSKRRKGTPLQSAMGMLTFYINRAGDNLPEKEKAKLERAKDELRTLFDARKD